MVSKAEINKLVKDFGWLYSDELGINLAKKRTKNSKVLSKRLFDWFLASYFIGVSNDDEYAFKVFDSFKEKGLVSPRAIVKSTWQRLMFVFTNGGGYTADDFKSVADLMVVCDNLLRFYDGDLVVMHDSSKDARDFEKRLRGLKAFPKESADLFLRELRGCLKYVDAVPEKEVVKAAKEFKLTERRSGRPVLKDLELFWEKKRFAKSKFRNFETALYWYGKHLED